MALQATEHTSTIRAKNLLPRALPQAVREKVETAVEALIAFLDAKDGDPDLEPSLGYANNFVAGDDREGDVGDEREPEECFEPSLAHTLDINQIRAHKMLARDSGGEDMEDEHDGREPCCEDEGAQCEDEGAQCEGEGEDEHYHREGAL